MKSLAFALLVASTVLSACDEEDSRTLLERQFDAHVAAAGLQRAKVTYASSPEDFASERFSLYTSGTAGKFRVDMAIRDSIQISLDDGMDTLYCSNSVKATTDGICTYEILASSGLGLFDFPLRSGVSNAGQPEVISESHEQILGTAARCFHTVDGELADGKVDYCYSADFRLLKSRWQINEASMTYIAIAVEAVADADFDPPYLIVESD